MWFNNYRPTSIISGRAASSHVPDKKRSESMPLFMIERSFAEKLNVTSESAAAINEINDEASVRWQRTNTNVAPSAWQSMCQMIGQLYLYRMIWLESGVATSRNSL
jgi:hypothetical protein